jgi:phage-related protein
VGVPWRIICRLDPDAVIIGEVFAKKTGKTPKKVVDACKRRFKRYDEATK